MKKLLEQWKQENQKISLKHINNEYSFGYIISFDDFGIILAEDIDVPNNNITLYLWHNVKSIRPVTVGVPEF